MALDLSAVKQRLEALNSKGTKKKTYEKIDYEKYFFKPKVGKYQIRFVPSRLDKQNPFKEIFFHYGLKKYPLVALTNYGEKDPVVDFCEQLRKTKDKEDWLLAKKMEPKMRVFAPIIVRGEEEKGVRLWEFGTLTYKQLLGLADDEDYGDFTDIKEGRDFTLEATNGEVAGRPSVKCELRIKPKTSVLSDDATLVEKWLNEQPNILELRKHFSYDEMKTILTEYLNPSTETSKPKATSEVEESEEDSENVPFETNKSPKVSKADKFSKLFA